MARILHVITGLGGGGAEGMLRRLCLADEANEHLVISLTDEGVHGRAFRELGIPVSSLGMVFGPGIAVKFYSLVRLIRGVRPDVVQTWLYHADLIGGAAARLAGVPRIVWNVRTGDVKGGREKPGTVAVVRLCGFLSRWIPDVIVYCARSAVPLHEEMGYSQNKGVIIPNGFVFGEAEDAAPVSCDRRSTRLLHLARFHPVKDHGTLLEAISLALGRGADIRLTLAGDGTSAETQDLVEIIRSRGIMARINLVGHVPDVRGLLQESDVLILSSVSEAFPNVLVEAMAAGVPCISTDVGDARDIVDDLGWIVQPRDPTSLASAIVEADEARRRRDWGDLRRAVQSSVRRRFGIDSAVDRYDAVWRPQVDL